MGKRLFLLLLHVISLVLLGFGWALDILKIEVSTHFMVDLTLFSEKRSVLTTLSSLWESRNYFPFILIGLFGILIPLIKSIILFILICNKNYTGSIHKYLGILSKWAMADVFVMSIFVAFLGARAMDYTSASLEPGFYFFTGYVLLSAIVTALFSKLLVKQ
ncbi:MAG: paraquat-inducible protein A [Bacteroidota bacterium]